MTKISGGDNRPVSSASGKWKPDPPGEGLRLRAQGTDHGSGRLRALHPHASGPGHGAVGSTATTVRTCGHLHHHPHPPRCSVQCTPACPSLYASPFSCPLRGLLLPSPAVAPSTGLLPPRSPWWSGLWVKPLPPTAFTLLSAGPRLLSGHAVASRGHHSIILHRPVTLGTRPSQVGGWVTPSEWASVRVVTCTEAWRGDTRSPSSACVHCSPHRAPGRPGSPPATLSGPGPTPPGAAGSSHLQGGAWAWLLGEHPPVTGTSLPDPHLSGPELPLPSHQLKGHQRLRDARPAVLDRAPPLKFFPQPPGRNNR